MQRINEIASRRVQLRRHSRITTSNPAPVATAGELEQYMAPGSVEARNGRPISDEPWHWEFRGV